ncbi:hypothetical protein BJ912DRAFT_903487 [Pholiota molesta]|nr:hypothetical protein BJ912DRAFT_903487 [Pholiota molesta]
MTHAEFFNSIGCKILSRSANVVHGAIHDSGERYPPSECHPGTREKILQFAMEWANKPLSQILWIHGPINGGKTTIAQTLCRRLQESGQLGGDIFFSRETYSDPYTLFPTLAYQLAKIHPSFAKTLDRDLFNTSIAADLQTQLENLIVGPLLKIPWTNIHVFVIDGFDQIGQESDQISILQLLESCLHDEDLPLKWIIVSRVQPWIRYAFDDDSLLGLYTCSLSLEHIPETDADIRRFFESGFKNIEDSHAMLHGATSEPWPSPDIIDQLVDKVSGQFIYAATILKDLGDPNNNPIEKLESILDIKKPTKNEGHLLFWTRFMHKFSR